MLKISIFLGEAEQSTSNGTEFIWLHTLDHSGLGENSLREVPAISPSVIQINPNNDVISSISGIFLGAQLGLDTFWSELAELSLRGNKLRNLEEDITRCLTNVT